MSETSVKMQHAGRNSIPDDDEEDIYDIEYSQPGLVFIFNNIEFSHPKLTTRNGAKNDQRRVVELFEELKFKVASPFVNMTADETKQILKDLAKRDYTKVGCVFVFIMSHGEMGTIFTTDCQKIFLEDFFAPFEKCLSLINKPKLFFIQACRGKSDHSSYVETDNPNPNSGEVQASSVRILTDSLYAYATTDGTLAPRDAENGTWFIQTLCDVIERDKYKDLTDILTRVNNIISKKEAIGYDQKTKRDFTVKSISEFMSRFRKKLFISNPKVI